MTATKERRWAFMSKKVIGAQDNPMLIRWRLLQTPWFGVYVHFIHREDLDRMPHDHPWTFWTWVIRGHYDEELYEDARLIARRPIHRISSEGQQTIFGLRPSPIMSSRRRWSRRKFPLHWAHRITHVYGKLTTLVVVGRKQRTWGFYAENGDFIDWREYHNVPGGWSPSQQHPAWEASRAGETLEERAALYRQNVQNPVPRVPNGAGRLVPVPEPGVIYSDWPES